MIILAGIFKLKKKCQKRLFMQPDYSCPMQKTAPKNYEYSKNEAILKIDKNGQQARAKLSFGSKIKIAKKVPKTTLQLDYICSMQKTSPKNNECSKIDAILKTDKNGQFAKAIVHQCAAGLMQSNSLELYPCCWRTTSKD